MSKAIPFNLTPKQPVAAVAACVGYVLTSDSSDHLVVLAGFTPLAAVWLAVSRLLWHAALGQPAAEARDANGNAVRVGGLPTRG